MGCTRAGTGGGKRNADGDLPGNPAADQDGSRCNRTGNLVKTVFAGAELGEDCGGDELWIQACAEDPWAGVGAFFVIEQRWHTMAHQSVV